MLQCREACSALANWGSNQHRVVTDPLGVLVDVQVTGGE